MSLRNARMSNLAGKHDAEADALEAARLKAEAKDAKAAKIIKKRARKN